MITAHTVKETKSSLPPPSTNNLTKKPYYLSNVPKIQFCIVESNLEMEESLNTANSINLCPCKKHVKLSIPKCKKTKNKDEAFSPDMSIVEEEDNKLNNNITVAEIESNIERHSNSLLNKKE